MPVSNEELRYFKGLTCYFLLSIKNLSRKILSIPFEAKNKIFNGSISVDPHNKKIKYRNEESMLFGMNRKMHLAVK